MTDIGALLAAYDEQARPAEHTNLPAGVHAEPDGPVVRVVGHFHQGFISAPRDLNLGGGELDDLIARQRDFFAARGEAVEWKTRGHDLPTDLVARLEAAGFVAEDTETVMIGVAADLAADPQLPDGVRLREVVEGDDLRRIADMETAVWGEDRSWLADELARQVARDGSPTVVLVAESDNLIVAAAWLMIEPGTQFGGLWGGSTLEAWRGRGIYRALVARRAQLAAARGVEYLQVDASDDSRPILERLGFTAVTTTTPYVWSPKS